MSYIIDNSALNRLDQAAVWRRLVPLLEREEAYTCGILDLEALFSARNRQDYEETRDDWAGLLRYVEIAEGDVKEALRIQFELAKRSQHRGAKLPDLIVAAVAKSNGLTVLHYDSDYDRIGEVGDVLTRVGSSPRERELTRPVPSPSWLRRPTRSPSTAPASR